MSLLLALTLLINFQLQDPGVPAQSADENPVDATPASVRLDAANKRGQLKETSLVKNIKFTNIGPTIMSGRVVDVDVSEADPTHFYVAYASGGLWKTTSNGTAFEPLFDHEAVMTIGDIAVDWERGETIWVGTGENNSSRSSYSGTGIYKSTDKGVSWEHMGLAETHHVGRVLIHPEDPNTVWVAALGHLYSPNPERGIYKTIDGGQTWQHTLAIDDNTGVIDLAVDPSDPDVLLAAAWHRTRRSWNFVESGATSGIYRSTDGGDTWDLVSAPESGFPSGEGVGRIGLAIYPGDPQVVYALVDNQDVRPEEEEVETEAGLTRDQLREISREDFLALDSETIETFLRDERFPDEYDADGVTEMVEEGKIEPIALVEFLEDADEALVNTDVIGGEVYRSEDGGLTWKRTHTDYIDSFYNTYGYYFGEIRVDANDPDKLYILGVPFLRSADGGESWVSVGSENVHGDHQALWVNPGRPGHLINGNDGGLNVSYDDGETWFKLNNPAVGQFYAIAVDMEEPFNVYGGLQDNGVWVGPSTYTQSHSWHGRGSYPYESIYGGDGMQVQVDWRTNDIVYTGSQFGFYSRVERSTGKRTRIRPHHDLGERPLRFNWQTPIHLSRHNQDILYLGSNKLHRSLNQGEDFVTISDDLTGGGQTGDVPFGTLATISESPIKFGLIYTGSDDGLVHMSPDGGVTWTDISSGLPENLWISRVVASAHDEGTVYVTLNGYRWDHFNPYLFVSKDFGQTWMRLGETLPIEPLNVVTEDPYNASVLYVGSDHAVYTSLDGGETFTRLACDMPDAPVHDLIVHERDKKLVVGTHGRSIYMGDIGYIQHLADSLKSLPLALLHVEEVEYSDDWGEKDWAWGDVVEPDAELVLIAPQTGTGTASILAEGGQLLKEWTIELDTGLNYLLYDLSVDDDRADAYEKEAVRAKRRNKVEMNPVASEMAEDSGSRYLLPGSYRVRIQQGEKEVEEALVITSN